MSVPSNSSPIPSTPAPQGAPPRPTAHHPLENNKTNPNSPQLSERQLAALRLLFLGHPPCSVAAQLHIDRHTLLRWRRSAAFLAELQRLHQQSASAPGRTTAHHGAPKPQNQQHQIQRFEPTRNFPPTSCPTTHNEQIPTDNPVGIKPKPPRLPNFDIDSLISSILNDPLPIPHPRPRQ
jgi:hypothetical protein